MNKSIKFAIGRVIGLTYGSFDLKKNRTLCQFWHDINKCLTPEQRLKVEGFYLKSCRGAEYSKKDGSLNHMSDHLMMAIIKNHTKEYSEVLDLARYLYPGPGAAEYFLGVKREEEHELAHNATSHENGRFNPFNGGLDKNYKINASSRVDEHMENIIPLSPWFARETGYRKVAIVSGFDLGKKTRGREYVVEIGLELGKARHEAVLRVIWNEEQNRYIGFVFKKFEPKCRINWDSWKKSHR